MRDWISFYDGQHSIYVNDRHKRVHYEQIARQIAALVPTANARVLDYGSGEALAADRLAASCGELLLFDAAPKVRAKLEQRFAGKPNIRVLSPQEIKSLPHACIDLLIANSLIQYLSEDEFDRLLELWQGLLKPGGQLVLADVIPPDRWPGRDVLALLRFAARERFLAAAVVGILRTAVSSYTRLRSELGLTRYSEAALRAKLEAAGLRASRLARNIGHIEGRLAFRGEKPAQEPGDTFPTA